TCLNHVKDSWPRNGILRVQIGLPDDRHLFDIGAYLYYSAPVTADRNVSFPLTHRHYRAQFANFELMLDQLAAGGDPGQAMAELLTTGCSSSSPSRADHPATGSQPVLDRELSSPVKFSQKHGGGKEWLLKKSHPI